VQVVRGVDPSLDREAVRVIQMMPRWKPGRQRGQAVRVRFTLPVVFRLQN
jgi:protein TonB